MSHPLHSASEKTIANLNSLLRGEISAVETYDQAIGHLQDRDINDLMANRDCHRKRVDLITTILRQDGATPDTTSGAWGGFARLVERGASLISDRAIFAALEEGEDRGLAQYREPGDLDASSMQLIETVLLPRQIETHERMRMRKLMGT